MLGGTPDIDAVYSTPEVKAQLEASRRGRARDHRPLHGPELTRGQSGSGQSGQERPDRSRGDLAE